MTGQPAYTTAQRWFALGLGCTVHVLFAASVAMMAFALYHGLHAGWGRLTGGWAWLVNGLLLVQFPLAHSWLLGDRGRAWMATLLPMNLGRPLATTTFAGISSLQVLACFAGWSPLSDGPLWTPGPGVHRAMAAGYAGAWLLLVLAMREAGLSLQTGSLGWRSVWRGEAPAFPALPVYKPLHQVIRQPIYAAFVLILWLAPGWTPEKIAVASLWSVYCVVGSYRKEKRFVRYHGDDFRAYQQRVPAWIPRWRRRQPVTATPYDAEVAVIGGGPVGLLLASLLAKAGHAVLVFEPQPEGPTRSMAIGITPPSLDILDELGLAGTFIHRGVSIRQAVVHENGRMIARLDMGGGGNGDSCILSLPQADTVQVLRQQVATHDRVRMMSGWRVTGLAQDRQGVNVVAVESEYGVPRNFRVAFAAGCDGARGVTATLAGIGRRVSTYAPRFRMLDAVDHTDLGAEAHLFFGRERPVESFPLPRGRRRWIVRSGWGGRDDLAESLPEAIARLTGYVIHPVDVLDHSSFQPRRAMASTFARGRVALCGDAAHLMSPIGGQGMNTGFGDAAFLARAYSDILRHGRDPAPWMHAYNRCRRRAFCTAATRSALGMRLGVLRGSVGSWFRRHAVVVLLGATATRRAAVRWFTMRSLPHPIHQVEDAFQSLNANGATP